MSTPTITFYTHPNSRGKIVEWMLAELDVPHQTITLEYDVLKNSDYLAINPMGKVPALADGETIITETAAICAYLADRFSNKSLAPPLNSPLRGSYFRWLFFVAGPLEAAIGLKVLDVTPTAKQKTTLGCGTLDEVVQVLVLAVQQASPYLCGAQFTAADVYVGAHIWFGCQFQTLPHRPEFDVYLATIQQRPAFQQVFKTMLENPA